jgi:hypothetical protein
MWKYMLKLVVSVMVLSFFAWQLSLAVFAQAPSRDSSHGADARKTPTPGAHILAGNLAPVSGAPAPGGVGMSAPRGAGAITITHSQSQAVVQDNSVACRNPNNHHSENSYYRVFNLPAFGINNDFTVQNVRIGVEYAVASGASQPLSARLYTLSGPFTLANLTPIGSTDTSVTNQSLTLLDIPVTGTAPAGSNLVVEILTPNGQAAGHSFYIGSNRAGQTGPSYIRAPDCSINQPTNLADLGFSGMHIVMNVTGEQASAEPTATNTPTATAEPTATNTPTVTAEPTPTNTPTATVEPTATNTPTATAEPTATNTPTATVEPTATNTPTATAEPTATNTPTATAEPTATNTPTATVTSTPDTGPTATPTIPPTAVLLSRLDSRPGLPLWPLAPLALAGLFGLLWKRRRR